MVLVIVVGFQLVLVGYQVRGKEDMRLIRVWAVTAITPLARLLEGVRGGGAGFLNDYVFLVKARDENHRLKEELAGSNSRISNCARILVRRTALRSAGFRGTHSFKK